MRADLSDDPGLDGLQLMAQQLAEAVGVLGQILVHQHLQCDQCNPRRHGIAAVGTAMLAAPNRQHHLQHAHRQFSIF